MTQQKIRVAVVGVGDFGRNHARVYREIENAELVGVVDTNAGRAQQVASDFGTQALPSLDALPDRVDAVSLAVPTIEHARIGCRLLEQGIDVLVEKPMAASLAEADQLIAAAKKNGRILQVGHLERFNPGVTAVQSIVTRPLFFEVHRLGVFTPRSLDIDVIYDVMIHDLDILLAFVNAPVVDLKAVGIPVVTDKVDIAHARIEFSTGAVANVTASRVSTEKVRKMRFFQPHEYISIDYTRRDALRVRVMPSASGAESFVSAMAGGDDGVPQFGFEKLPTQAQEPLLTELRHFLDAARSRRAPLVDGLAGRRALELAHRVMTCILEHAQRVQLSGVVSQARPAK